MHAPRFAFHYWSELARQDRNTKTLPKLRAQDLAAFSRQYILQFFCYVGTNSVLVFDNCQDAAGERSLMMFSRVRSSTHRQS
jgi:hypothetical protein